MDKKRTVAVIFGGKSPEHEISKISAKTIVSHMSEEQYDVIPVFITKDGEWLLYDGQIDNMLTGQWEKYAVKAVISPDTAHHGLLRIVGERVKCIHIDVAFSALHGEYGEDGAIQGLFALAGIPYVGCGILSSGLCMDKYYTKKIVEGIGIRQAKHYTVHRHQIEELDTVLQTIENEIGYPCFVKPSATGSSVGVSKALDRQQAEEAIKEAAQFGDKILVEKAIVGREVECGVLGNQTIEASPVGEIIAADEFYSYDAKYNDRGSKTIVPAEIPYETSEDIRQKSIQIFQALGGSGLARVDFFLEHETGEVVFNEINTMPGFTGISMYPMLWQEAGLSLSELIDRLIQLAQEA